MMRSISKRVIHRNLCLWGRAFSDDYRETLRIEPKRKIFNVSYLVNSLGLTKKLAESISRKLGSEGNPDSVLNLLTSHGFADSQISNIITTYPRLLTLDAEKLLAPKLKFLQSRGASTSELTEIVSKVPKILAIKKDKAISRHYDFVKEIIETDKSQNSCQYLQHLDDDNKLRNLSVLRDLGVPQKLLFSMLVSDKRIYSGKEKFEKSLKKVVEMGFDPTTPKFIIALRVLYESSDKAIEDKVNVFRKLGFDVEDVWRVFKKMPKFLTYSEQKIVSCFETFLGLGFSRDEFEMMVKHFPLCITYSPVLLKKKTELLVKKIKSVQNVDVSHRQDGRKGKVFGVAYLIVSLGLTKKLAESILSKVSSEGKGDPDSVLTLLWSYGFTDSQISNIIRTYPRLLMLDAEETLAPKLKFLQSRAASNSELTEIVSKVPKILGKSKAISIYYDFIKEMIQADKSSKFETLSLCVVPGKAQENKLRNILVLRELGVPQRSLLPLLIFGTTTLVCGKERFEESLRKVIEMGFDPTNTKFVKALSIIYKMSDKVIEERINIYKRLGFVVEDVWEMFKKMPNLLTYSEEKITHKFEILKKCGLLEEEICFVFKKFPPYIGVSEQRLTNSAETFLRLGFSRDELASMIKRVPSTIGFSHETVKKKTEFLVKKMNWPLKAIVSNPQVLGLSMEKRIVPRCNVIKALMSRGLIGSEVPSMSYVLVCTDESFLKRYVMRKYDDKKLVTELMAFFTGENRKKTDNAYEP